MSQISASRSCNTPGYTGEFCEFREFSSFSKSQFLIGFPLFNNLTVTAYFSDLLRNKSQASLYSGWWGKLLVLYVHEGLLISKSISQSESEFQTCKTANICLVGQKLLAVLTASIQTIITFFILTEFNRDKHHLNHNIFWTMRCLLT